MVGSDHSTWLFLIHRPRRGLRTLLLLCLWFRALSEEVPAPLTENQLIEEWWDWGWLPLKRYRVGNHDTS